MLKNDLNLKKKQKRRPWIGSFVSLMKNPPTLLRRGRKTELFIKAIKVEQIHGNTHSPPSRKWSGVIKMHTFHFQESSRESKMTSWLDVLIFVLESRVEQKVLLPGVWNLEAERLLWVFLDVLGRKLRLVFKDAILPIWVPTYLPL